MSGKNYVLNMKNKEYSCTFEIASSKIYHK